MRVSIILEDTYRKKPVALRIAMEDETDLELHFRTTEELVEYLDSKMREYKKQFSSRSIDRDIL